MRKNEKNKILFSNKLKELRNVNNLTLDEFAKKSKIGIESIKSYEKDYNTPSIKSVVKICNTFDLSLDYFILWENCYYPRDMKLLKLIEKIDKTNQTTRYQIESTINSLLNNQKYEIKKVEIDSTTLQLTTSIHKNIELIVENKKITHQEIANNLGINRSAVSNYKRNIMPALDKLIKLSKLFDISINAIVTGEKLNYDFENMNLKIAFIQADQFLSLEDHKFLIKLMQNIISLQK